MRQIYRDARTAVLWLAVEGRRNGANLRLFDFAQRNRRQKAALAVLPSPLFRFNVHSRSLNARGARASYRELISDHGHDAFLADPANLAALINDFIEG